MAVVYLARQRDLERSVALKELHAAQAADASLVRRFVRESRVAGALAHPNVVTVYDYFEWEDTPYIAMEYIASGSLRPHIGRLSLAQIAGVLEGVLAGLAHAEQHQIVHRDLKPENVMVTADGRVKIADFGISKATAGLRTSTFLTATGTTLGTPSYMAPEQAMAQEVGPWSDLYSVGCMAYEMVTGELPFTDTDSPLAILLRHVNEIPVSPGSRDPSIDGRVSDWIDQLLRKDPRERFQSAEDAWEELDEIIFAIEGPRWRRASRLLASGAERPDAVKGPYTPPPRGAAPRGEPFASFDRPAVDTPAPATPTDPATGSSGLSESGGYESFVSSRPPRPPTHELESGLLGPPTPERPAPAPPTGPWQSARLPSRQVEVTAGAKLAATVSPDTQAPPAPPGTQATTVGRPPSRKLIAAGGLALVAVAVSVAALMSRGDQAPRAPAATPGAPLAAGALQVSPPPGWARLASPIEIPGLKLTNAISLAAGGRRGGPAALLGLAPRSAHRASLLPTELTSALGLRPEVVPDGNRVRLRAGGFAALRYLGLRPRGFGRSVTVYAVPTSVGVATLACIAPTEGSERFESDCQRIADALTLRGAKAFPVGASRAFASAVNEALKPLDRVRRAQRAELSSARVARDQAAPTAAIAASYRSARAALARIEHSPAEGMAYAALTRALGASAAGYRDLAAAARGQDRARYRTAAGRAERGERDVESAIRALADGGYSELLSVPFRSHAVPAMKPARRPPASPTPAPSAQPTPTAAPRPTPTPRATPAPEPTIQIPDCSEGPC
jgi:serine/threonine protein kinase